MKLRTKFNLGTILENCFVIKKVKAEDVNTNEKDEKPVNFEELIAKARQEERDKLYPKISKFEKQITYMTNQHNNTLLTLASKEKELEGLKNELETLKKKTATPEEVKELNSIIKTLKKENEQLLQNKVDVETITNQLNQEWEVKLYREQKLREIGNLIPELVIGTTKEEIDLSIENSQKRYNEIIASVQDQKVYIPPASNVNTKGYSIKDINAMDIRNMSMDEWKEKRKSLGLV